MNTYMRCSMQLPQEDFNVLKQVAEECEVTIVDVVKELIHQYVQGKLTTKEDKEVSNA